MTKRLMNVAIWLLVALCVAMILWTESPSEPCSVEARVGELMILDHEHGNCP